MKLKALPFLILYTFITVVTVAPVTANDPPVVYPIGPQSTTEGVRLIFTVSAWDPEGAIPSLWYDPLPDGAKFEDHGDGTGTFDWKPNFSQEGMYNVIFYAKDEIIAQLKKMGVE